MVAAIVALSSDPHQLLCAFALDPSELAFKPLFLMTELEMVSAAPVHQTY